MSIVQVKGMGGNVGLDRSSFVGGRVPQEIQRMIKPLSKLDRDTFANILKVVVGSFQGKQPEYKKIVSVLGNKVNEETLAILYCGTQLLLNKAMRIPLGSLKKEHFIQDLQEMQIPETFHEDLVSCVFGSQRSQIDEQFEKNRPRLPSLENFDWRVDVTISTGVLNRVLVRGVAADMTLSDGSVKNFEMSVAKFQDLRFQVASVLSEMEKLEKRSILKIKD